MKMALRVAAIAFLLVSVMHFLRLINKVEVVVAGITAPLWISGLAAVITLLLAIWMFKSIK